MQSAESPPTIPPEKETEVGGIFINSVEQKKCEESNCGCWTIVKNRKKSKMERVNKWKQFDMSAINANSKRWTRNVELHVVEKGNEQWERVEATVDSGAGETVGPKSIAAHCPITPTASSMAGIGYVAAMERKYKTMGKIS